MKLDLRQWWRLPAPDRKDESMDLLNDILEQAVDPGYAAAASKNPRPRRHRLGLFVVMAVVGTLVAVSAVQSLRAAPAIEQQRTDLIAEVQHGNDRIEDQRARIAELQAETDEQRRHLLAGDEAAADNTDRIEALAPTAGAVAMSGPGLVIVVDDATAERADGLNRVLDSDLQLLVNGLWRSGAEAVAINGQRITTKTAIRSAGEAITVNYRSLSGPYTLTVIGPDEGFDAGFLRSPEGRLWTDLHEHYGLRFDVQRNRRVQVPAESSLVVRHARRAS